MKANHAAPNPGFFDDISEYALRVFDDNVVTKMGQAFNSLRDQVMPEETNNLPSEMNDFDFEAERDRLRNMFSNQQGQSFEGHNDFVNQRRNEAVEWMNSWDTTDQSQASGTAYSNAVQNMIAEGNRIFNAANAGNN